LSRKTRLYIIAAVIIFVSVLFVVFVSNFESNVMDYKKVVETDVSRLSLFGFRSFLGEFEKQVSQSLMNENISVPNLSALNQKLSQFCSFVVWLDSDGNVVEVFGNPPHEDLYEDNMIQAVLYEDYGTFYTDLYALDDGLQIRTVTTLRSSEKKDLVFVAGKNLSKESFTKLGQLVQRAVFFVSRDGKTFGEASPIDEGLLRKASESHRPEVDLTSDSKMISVVPFFDFQEWNVKGFIINHSRVERFKKDVFQLKIVDLFLFFGCVILLIVGISIVARRNKKALYILTIFSVPLLLMIFYGYTFQVPGVLQKEYSDYVHAAARVLGEFGRIWLEDGQVEGIKQILNVQVLLSKNESIVSSTLRKELLKTIGNWVAVKKVGDVEHGEVLVNKVPYTYWRLRSNQQVLDVVKEKTPLVNAATKIRFSGIIAIVICLTFVWLLGFSIRNADRPRLLRATLIGYIFLAPALIHLIWWAAGPVGFSFFLAFHRWNVIDPAKPFVGLDNFKELFRDKLFWNAMKNTVLFSLQVPIGMFFSLLLAMAVNRPTRSMALLRTVYYLPAVTAGVSTTIVWRWILNKDFGILNYILGIFGIPKIPWLTSPRTALIAIMLMSIWQALGSQMIIFLAGLQSIPQAFYEAASIDGANGFQKFRKITLPLLKPTSIFVLVTSVIGSFQVFTPVYVLTQGGPLRSTDVVFYHIWESAWIELRMGYAAAQSWMLFLVLVVLTYLQFKLFGKESWQQYF